MFLTIWRHGQAGTASSDRLRELTAAGADDIGFGCQRYHALCESSGIPHPDRVLYSEWRRTTQTAELIAGAFTHATLEPCDALVPGRRSTDVDAALDDLLGDVYEPDMHLLLVSHQPLVSALVDHYERERGRSPGLVPGGVAVVKLDAPAPGCGRVMFIAQPPEYHPWS